MRVKDKINLDCDGMIKNGAVTIVAFGDSITHGGFVIGENDYNAVYHNVLKNKILAVKDSVPVNVINAGIGGTTAKIGLERIDAQVLRYNPDLIIVCFGLNDINGSIEDYVGSLKTIFEKCKSSGAETVFLTPNTLNYYVADDVDENFKDYAKVTAEYQTSGRMDKYIYAAIETAKNVGVKVCDCYSKWKELAKTQDTTQLLANKINHPSKEMHELFANELFKIIFDL